MTQPTTLVAAALIAGTAAVLLTLASRPARGQSDQWPVIVERGQAKAAAAAPAKPSVRKGPKFYIKRKARSHKRHAYRDARRVRSHVPVRADPRAASQWPASRAPLRVVPFVPPPADQFADAFAAFAEHPIPRVMVRTVSVMPPFIGAFHIRTPAEQPPGPAPDDTTQLPDPRPFRDTPAGKAAIIAIFLGALAGAAAFGPPIWNFFTAKGA